MDTLEVKFLSTVSKVSTTLYSVIKTATRQSSALDTFHLNSHTLGFHPMTEKLENLVLHNKLSHRSVNYDCPGECSPEKDC